MNKILCSQCNREQMVADDIKTAFCKYCGKSLDMRPKCVRIKCPRCSKQQSVDEGKGLCFCKYCGFRIDDIKSLQVNPIDSKELLSCPSCAAPFKRILDDGNGRYAVCDFCGRKQFIDYNAQEAYEVEMAKIRAHENSQKSLLNDLIEVEDAVLNIDSKFGEQDALVKKISSLNKQEDWLMRYRIIEMYVYPSLISFTNISLAGIFHHIVAYTIFAILSVGAFIYFLIRSYKRGKEVAKEIETNERTLLDVINDLNIYNEILSKHKDLSIPSDMLDKDAYDCVLGIIAENDLDTLSEAVSIYRYWKHKQNIRKMNESIRRREQERRVSAREVYTEDGIGHNAAIGLAAGIGVGLVARSILRSLF